MTEETPGYIPIFRKFFNHYLWEENREFSKAEAWIDCIQMARYKKSKKKKLMAGNLIEWGYGQFPASVRFLKDRWNWGSNTKVENFLSLLESDDMIKIEKGQGQNVITLCNYSIYDIRNEGGKDTKKTHKGQGKDTSKTLQGQNRKNVNNVNNDNNISPLVSDYSNIKSMEEPLTEEQGKVLIEQYGETAVKEILMAMENWKPLKKKNKSANLTAHNWLKKRTNGDQQKVFDGGTWNT